MVASLLNAKGTLLSLEEDKKLLISTLIHCLGDNKIAIRQLTQHILNILIDSVPNIVEFLVPSLELSNWHIREEILIFIIRLMLTHKDKVLDFSYITKAIAKLLNDPVPKVIQVAYEALTTLAHIRHKDHILEILINMLDEFTYRKLYIRIEAGELPILKQDGELEFPYLTSRLFVKSSFYTNHNLEDSLPLIAPKLKEMVSC